MKLNNQIKPISNMPALTLSGCQVSATSLHLPPGLTFEAWDEIGAKLLQVRQGVEWWIADYLNYGEREYGKAYKRAALLTGYKITTLRNIVCVANKFEPSRRHDALPFSYYLDVAGLPVEKQDELLAAAASGKLKRKQVRAAARAYRLPQSAAMLSPAADVAEWAELKAALQSFANRFPFVELIVSDFLEDVEEWLDLSEQSPLEFLPALLERSGGLRTDELVRITGYARESLLAMLEQLELQRLVRRDEQGGKTDAARGARPVLWMKI